MSWSSKPDPKLASKNATLVEQATQEMEAITEMYNRMTDQCFRKCVSQYNDSDLSKGEGVCIDRCVQKYMDVQNKVGLRLAGFAGGMPPQ